MTPLEQKLQQLNLKAMSRQAEAMIADAAARNLSVPATFELLADIHVSHSQTQRFSKTNSGAVQNQISAL